MFVHIIEISELLEHYLLVFELLSVALVVAGLSHHYGTIGLISLHICELLQGVVLPIPLEAEGPHPLLELV